MHSFYSSMGNTPDALSLMGRAMTTQRTKLTEIVMSASRPMSHVKEDSDEEGDEDADKKLKKKNTLKDKDADKRRKAFEEQKIKKEQEEQVDLCGEEFC